MAKRRIEIEAGTGNVFADLGYADAKERTLKVELALEVNRILKQSKLTQAQAAELLGVVQPHVSDLVRYRLNRFSVERLIGRGAGVRYGGGGRDGWRGGWSMPSSRRTTAASVRLNGRGQSRSIRAPSPVLR